MKIRSLRTHFIAAGCLLLAVTIACGIWSVLTFDRLGSALVNTLDENQSTIEVAVELIYALEREDDALLLSLNGDADRAADELRAQRNRFEQAYSRLKSHLNTAADVQAYAALRIHVDAYRQAGDAMVAAAGQHEAIDNHFKRVNEALRTAVADCRHFRESNVDAMRRAGTAVRNDAHRSSLVVAGLTLAALLLSAAVITRLTRRVMRPIGELDRAVNAIRHDDLEHRVPVRSTDELGRLAEGFNRMADALAEYRREADDRFRQVAENIHEIFWMSDARDERVLYISPGYEELWGRSCQSLYEHPRSWIESVHLEDQARVIANVEERSRGEFTSVEFRVVRPNGSLRWIRSRAFPTNDPDGNVSRIAGLAEDITDRKRAEEALRESEERFRFLVQNSSDIISLFDSEGTVLYQAPSVRHLLGHRPQDRIGRNVFRDPIVHPDDMAAKQAFFETMRSHAGVPVVAEFRLRHADGSWRDIEAIGQNFLDNPIVAGIVANYRDITERKRAEEELRLAKETAESANRAKDEFLANVSHEIRTPMNAILGMTELALDTPMADNLRQCLKTVKSAADNLLGIINDLLDFSRIEAGKMELNPAAFSLRAALNDTLRALAARAHRKGLELVSDVQSGVPDALIGDIGRLRQVVLNLVGNAIKFTSQGEVVVHVESVPDATLDEECTLRFTVRDTGIGIPADKQGAIFRAFEQEDTSTTRKYGGTGLGLTISTRLVQLMGGTISVQSEPERGSTFTFTARFLRQPHSSDDRAAQTPLVLHHLRVLIVDDNTTNRHILEEWMHDWQMEPAAAADGVAALDALWDAVSRGNPFELVMLDARMPDIDGLALAATIRRRSELAATRIILLTSEDRPSDWERTRELRINAHLLKPVQQDELLEVIYRVMSDGKSVPEPVPAAAVVPAGAPLRVLVAEDNEFNAQLIELLLVQKGHQVRVVGNGREALNLAIEGGVDLFLLDIHMPELDGFQVVTAIRLHEQQVGGHLPIIALTARSRKSDRERALAAGMDDFLTKPFAAADLWAAMQRIAPADLQADSTALGPLDPNAVLAACGSDANILREICKSFQSYLPDQLKELQDAVRQGDASRLREAAHKLCSVIAAFSSTAGATVSNLEDLAASGRLEGCHSLVDQLESIARELLKQTEGLTIDALRGLNDGAGHSNESIGT